MTRPMIALLALVTAAVTLIGGCTLLAAQTMGSFEVVITNETTGMKHPWSVRTWETMDQCRLALGNTNDILRAVADNDPANVPEDPTGTDEELYKSVTMVVLYLLQNTGHLPNLSIECARAGTRSAYELPGSPA